MSEKNLEELLAAMEELVKDHPELDVVVSSSGEEGLRIQCGTKTCKPGEKCYWSARRGFYCA